MYPNPFPRYMISMYLNLNTIHGPEVAAGKGSPCATSQLPGRGGSGRCCSGRHCPGLQRCSTAEPAAYLEQKVQTHPSWDGQIISRYIVDNNNTYLDRHRDCLQKYYVSSHFVCAAVAVDVDLCCCGASLLFCVVWN